MSYCRWSRESDLYIFADCGGGITCCACSLNGGTTVNRETTEEMVDHVRAHRFAGHKVPSDLIDALLEDPVEEDSRPGRAEP